MAAENPLGAERLAGMLAANASLAVAVLFYMGWSSTNAIYAYFNVNPLDLDLSVTEYVLRSSALLSSVLVLSGGLWLAVTGLPRVRPAELLPGWAVRLVPAALARAAGRLRERAGDPLFRARTGLLLLLAAGTCVALSVSGVVDLLYPTLALTGAGAVLLTGTAGSFSRALGLVTAAACALWAAGVYAAEQGRAEAEQIAADLAHRTAVVVYSVKPIGLSGPGVEVQELPKEHTYTRRYVGLRLLVSRGGRYYLLPVGWRHGVNATYLFKESDTTRIEILPGS